MRSFGWLVSSILLCSSVAMAQGPRVAIVVSGDPSQAATDAVGRLEASLASTAELTLPSDEATRTALRGAPRDPGAPDDGLDELRGLRRRLGITADGDRDVLDTVGARLELAVVVVVHGATQPTAKVYDVAEHRFFTGEAALDASSLDSARQFVVARATAAERRRLAPAPEATADAAAGQTSPASAATPTTAAPTRGRRPFMRRNWPFFVAGALLVGATTYFIVQRNQTDTSPPVIHIRPGGN